MARLSINEITTYRWTFEEDVARYVAAGVQAIGVWRQKLSEYGDSKGVELLAESGLPVACLLWAGGFTGSDGRTYDESVADGLAALQLAAEMQAHCLVVYTGARGGHTTNHAQRLFYDAIGKLCPLAEENNVILAIEPVHADAAGDCTFLTDLDATLEAIRRIAHPQVKMVFDTYHLCQQTSHAERIAEIVDHVGLVQLADSREPPGVDQNRCPLGAGNLPLAEVVGAFKAAGYDGDFDVELIGEEFEHCEYDTLIQQSTEQFRQWVGE